MSRIFVRIVIGLAVFAGAAAVAFFLTPRIASETLRLEAEMRLSDLMKSRVIIGEARFTAGLGIQLEGTNVSVWHADGREAGLEVDRVEATVRPLPLLMGQLRFSRILLDGAHLRVARDDDGTWHPTPLENAADRERLRTSETPTTFGNEFLRPLIEVENLARVLLDKRRIADVFELRNGTVVFVDAQAENRSAPPLLLALESLNGKLRRSRLSSAGRLTIRARVTDAQIDRGALELEASRDRAGAIRVALAMTDLELAALAPYVRSFHPTARIDATVSGALVFETAAVGEGLVEVDLVGTGVNSIEPRTEAIGLSADRVEAVGKLEISPQQVRFRGIRVSGGEFKFEADVTLARPLQAKSFARVELAFNEVDVAEVRHVIGWLPEVEREEADNVVQILETGRLHSLRASGSATLSAWQAFLAGRTNEPPRDFVIDATLSDTIARVGDGDRLEDLSGRLWWSGDRAEVIGARATLNGKPLPALDVAIDGVTKFLAGDPARRQLESGGVPLQGIEPLWRWFQSGHEEDDPETHFAVGLVIDRLHHPMFLWPIENMSAALWDTEQGLHIVSDGGTWAGVPVSGEADWDFIPEEHVRVELTAATPVAGNPVPSAADAWTEGEITVGILHGGAWRQQHASGRFSAHGGAFQFDDLQLPLNPQGHVEAAIEIDVGLDDRVPYRLSFAMEGGSVEALAEQLGQASALGKGRADIAGSFQGVLRPGTPFLEGTSGLLEVVATDGTLRQSLPAVVAVALASQAYNPFMRRDEVRYDRCQTTLEFDDGVMSTTGFSLDGPDLRVFATGELDLLRPPHSVDAQVALFLFRQIDLILEKIPIVNFLLLGTNDNLIGAHFRLSGPWEDPKATAVPFSALASGPASIVEQGPASIVLQTVPMFMMKGIEAIEAMLGLGKSHPKPAEKARAAPLPSES